jgi:L-2-hydroxyglutarate oxidase LhgO
VARSTVVIGGGIIGAAVARTLAQAGDAVVLADKEGVLARHQTGNNSGVVHAGVYYAPGSLKATLCRRGVALLDEFCTTRGIPNRPIGKLVIAADDTEVSRLEGIHQRAEQNGVPQLAMLDRSGIARIEPHAAGVAALHSPTTAITDFPAVTRALADDVRDAGGTVLLGHEAVAIEQRAAGATVAFANGERRDADLVVVCAAARSDELAERSGSDADPRIVPFRGDYLLLRPERSSLVRGLIYPVPDPRFPFLGVHFTPRLDGRVLVGPSAVLSLRREVGERGARRWRDARRTATWPGTWRLVREHGLIGVRETVQSLSLAVAARGARRLVPGIGGRDLERGPYGIRAQAVRRNGELVDDFVIDVQGPIVHLRNAPSPGATSSLAIAEHIVGQLGDRTTRRTA